MSGTALVLAGHGSHISPQTAGLVWQHVDALRAMSVADEITAAFWKETPSFRQVFRTLAATDITVIPMFTARGYFTQTVIPAEMRLAGSITVHDGRTIRYTRTLSEHPHLSCMVRQRVEEALHCLGGSPDRIAVAIIGHSTRRNPESRKAVETQVEQIQRLGLASDVIAAYLDDDPGVETVYMRTAAPVLIAIPYFMASGSHTTLDVPRRLGLAVGPQTGGPTVAQVNNRTVYYARPVGVDESLRGAILDLAHEAGAPLHAPQAGSAWDSFPAAGRAELIEAVSQSGTIEFGQLRLALSLVQRLDDRSPDERIVDPGTVRAKVRERPFRPLATSHDLPGGWHVPVNTPEMLHAVVETIYPGAVADWAAHRHGNFPHARLETIVGRQTGLYRELISTTEVKCTTNITRTCGRCVRHPTWANGESPVGSIPCGEPCNQWMSEALVSGE